MALHVLVPWANFYVMVGSSAAALTGLMFVVITLVTGNERAQQQTSDGVSTFSTPTVVHFGAALLVSAVLSAPWHHLVYPAALLTCIGLFGVAYILNILRKARRIETYNPDAEDWTWYTVLPGVAYVAIALGALLFSGRPASAMFAPAAGAIMLIFIGIHNAWDIVTYLAIVKRENDPANARAGDAGRGNEDARG